MSRASSPWRDRVIFVVGARRSGTNWIGRILGAHPQVATIPGETFLFAGGIRPLAERFQHGLAGSARTGAVYMERDAFLDATRDFCDAVLDGLAEAAGLPSGGRLVERTPNHALDLDLIGAVYPDAWIVHVVRDGRDVARSLVSQRWGPGSVGEAASEWASAVGAARRDGARLDRYREVRYEDLSGDDPSHSIAELFAWLGLSSGEAAVDAAVRAAGARYNVDAALPEVAVGKWRSTFTPADLAAFDAAAGDLLRELGYADAAPPEAADGAAVAGRPRRGHRVGGLGQRVGAALRGAQDGWRRRPGHVQREVLARLDEGQLLLEAFMGDVAARRFDHLVEHCADAVQVRSAAFGARDEWVARGPAAVQRLAEELEADPALRGRQVRGDVHPGVPGYTLVTVYESADGQRHARTFVVGMSGGRITQLTRYAG